MAADVSGFSLILERNRIKKGPSICRIVMVPIAFLLIAVFPDTLWMFLILYGERRHPEIRKKVYDNWLRNLKSGIHELLIHPSLMGEEWANILGRPDSYIRFGDYEYWTSPETKALADELGIIFIGYRELQKLQAKNWGLEADSVQLNK